MFSQAAAQNEPHQRGINLPLELEIEEDLEKEIHHFVKLSRLGHYAEAHEFFHHTLKQHDRLFPIVAEYLDMLLEQGNYGQAREYIEQHPGSINGSLNTDEMQLLMIMKSLAELYSKGALRSALTESKRAWTHLNQEGEKDPGTLNETQIRIFEIYIKIIVFAYQTSQWVDEEWMSCPLPQTTNQQTGNGFVQWFCLLKNNRLVWEASRVLRALLPLMPTLLANDLAELLDDAWISGPKSQQFSAPELWASVMITLYQAHFWLNATLGAKSVGYNISTVDNIFKMAKGRLDFAEQKWNMLASYEDSLQSNLQLALEKICFDAAMTILSSTPTDHDPLFVLSDLLFEANVRNDLQSQIVARLYILLLDRGTVMDGDDLYSIFELLEVDCGNTVELVRIWSLFAAWVLDSREPLLHMERDRYGLLLSQHMAPAPFDPQWKDLLEERSSRMHSMLSLDELAHKDLAFDQSQDNYPLEFDIPGFTTSYALLRQRLLARIGGRQDGESLFVADTFAFEVQNMLEQLGVIYGRLFENRDELGGRQSEIPEPRGLVFQLNWSTSTSNSMTDDGDKEAKMHHTKFQTTKGKRKAAPWGLPKGKEASEAGPNEGVLGSLTQMRNLVIKHTDEGQWREAGDLQVQILEICKKEFGLEDPDTLSALNHLASTYQHQGRWKEAEDLKGQISDICKREFGLKNPDTLSTLIHLASTYRHQRRWKEATRKPGSTYIEGLFSS